MSFFNKLCCCSDDNFGPEEEFIMIMDEEMVNRKPKKGKARVYGSKHERMTSPGREAMRDYITTPEKPKRVNPNAIRAEFEKHGKLAATGKPKPKQKVIYEEVEVVGRGGK